MKRTESFSSPRRRSSGRDTSNGKGASCSISRSSSSLSKYTVTDDGTKGSSSVTRSQSSSSKNEANTSSELAKMKSPETNRKYLTPASSKDSNDSGKVASSLNRTFSSSVRNTSSRHTDAVGRLEEICDQVDRLVHSTREQVQLYGKLAPEEADIDVQADEAAVSAKVSPRKSKLRAKRRKSVKNKMSEPKEEDSPAKGKEGHSFFPKTPTDPGQEPNAVHFLQSPISIHKGDSVSMSSLSSWSESTKKNQLDYENLKTRCQFPSCLPLDDEKPKRRSKTNSYGAKDCQSSTSAKERNRQRGSKKDDKVFHLVNHNRLADIGHRSQVSKSSPHKSLGDTYWSPRNARRELPRRSSTGSSQKKKASTSRGENQKLRPWRSAIGSKKASTRDKVDESETEDENVFYFTRGPFPPKALGNCTGFFSQKNEEPQRQKSFDLDDEQDSKFEDIHFVRHPCPSVTIPVNQSSSPSDAKRDSEKRFAKKRVHRSKLGDADDPFKSMPLNRFLKESGASANLAADTMDDDDPWQAATVEFSYDARSLCNEKPTMVVKQQASQQGAPGAAEQTEKDLSYQIEMPQEDETQTSTSSGNVQKLNQSVTSLSIGDILSQIGAVSPVKAFDIEKEDDSKTASLSESQSLSLCDIHPGDDDNSTSESSSPYEENVTNRTVTDPTGRKGLYTGMFSKSSNRPCGHGRMEYFDSGDIFEGQFVHGHWTGYGRCVYSNGEDYTGFFDNETNKVKHGHGIMTYPDGRVFDGIYSNGHKVVGKMTYPDGSIYIGAWNGGVRHGRGTYTFSNGAIFHGEFQDDKIHGSGVLKWANGRRYVGEWRHGVRQGQGTEFGANGAVAKKGPWANDQPVSIEAVAQQ